MQLYSGPVGMQTLSNAGRADATGVELEAKWRFAPGWSWDINGNVIRSEFTNDSELYHGNRVPFVPRYGAGSSVNGVIDTRYGALMPRLAVRWRQPAAARRLRHPGQQHWLAGDGTDEYFRLCR